MTFYVQYACNMFDVADGFDVVTQVLHNDTVVILTADSR
jgi:hypothetical protein